MAGIFHPRMKKNETWQQYYNADTARQDWVAAPPQRRDFAKPRGNVGLRAKVRTHRFGADDPTPHEANQWELETFYRGQRNATIPEYIRPNQVLKTTKKFRGTDQWDISGVIICARQLLGSSKGILFIPASNKARASRIAQADAIIATMAEMVPGADLRQTMLVTLLGIYKDIMMSTLPPGTGGKVRTNIRELMNSEKKLAKAALSVAIAMVTKGLADNEEEAFNIIKENTTNNTSMDTIRGQVRVSKPFNMFRYVKDSRMGVPRLMHVGPQYELHRKMPRRSGGRAIRPKKYWEDGDFRGRVKAERVGAAHYTASELEEIKRRRRAVRKAMLRAKYGEEDEGDIVPYPAGPSSSDSRDRNDYTGEYEQDRKRQKLFDPDFME